LARQAAPRGGGTGLLLKTTREQSLWLGLDPFGSEPVPGAMFLKGGEVRVDCDVLATEVIEDLLLRGVLPRGREVAAQMPVELPAAQSSVVPKNRSRSTATRCSRNSTVGDATSTGQGVKLVDQARGRNGSGRARGYGFTGT
jgi:hypothetical protein